MKSYNPCCDMWTINFLFITSSTTDTGILVNSVLTSKETSVSTDLMIFPLRLSANPLLSLTKQMILIVYRLMCHRQILWV